MAQRACPRDTGLRPSGSWPYNSGIPAPGVHRAQNPPSLDCRSQQCLVSQASRPSSLATALLLGDGHRVRCFCPVPGCGHGDAVRATGWGSHEAMRYHLDDHCSGTLAGAVPVEYLRAHRLDLCSVCGLLVGCRYNGTHPRCRPQGRHQAANHSPAAFWNPGLPTFDTIMGHTAPTLRHVPHVARALGSMPRSGGGHGSSLQQYAPKSCPRCSFTGRWAPPQAGCSCHPPALPAGEHMELWDELVPFRPRTKVSSSDLGVQHARCCSLAAEGELSRACAALTEPSPLPPSRATLDLLAAQHPQAAAPDLGQLGPARATAVAELTNELIVRAIRSFPRASAPGPSGLRADHIKETLSTAHGNCSPPGWCKASCPAQEKWGRATHCSG